MDSKSQERLRALHDALRARIAEHPYEIDAHINLWHSVQDSKVAKDVRREIYEEFLTKFPTAAPYWRHWIHQELQDEDYLKAKELFGRILPTLRDLRLWELFVEFITKTSDLTTTEGRNTVSKAYASAIEAVGLDVDSMPLWMNYINFETSTKAQEGSDNSLSAGGGDRVNTIRSIYHRALGTPLRDLERLWKSYDSFEKQLNVSLAQALIQDHAPRYMAARQCFRELRLKSEGTLRGSINSIKDMSNDLLATPPASDTSSMEKRLSSWNQLIMFEQSNPARGDNALCLARVSFCFEQCLMQLYHYPHIWLEYAAYVRKNGQWAVAKSIYERGISAIPSSLALSFSLADALESLDASSNVEDIQRIYDTLLQNTTHSLAFIQTMKWANRNLGLQSARRYFLQGRLQESATWHLYVAAASLERYSNNDTSSAAAGTSGTNATNNNNNNNNNITTAMNIFEAGLKKFSNESDYIQQYVDFLIGTDQLKNVRALFERVLATASDDVALPLWNKFVDFERKYGDLAALTSVETRRSEAYSKLDSLRVEQIASRYEFEGLFPLTGNEMAAYSAARGGELLTPARVLIDLTPTLMSAADAAADVAAGAKRKDASSRFSRAAASERRRAALDEARVKAEDEAHRALVAKLPAPIISNSKGFRQYDLKPKLGGINASQPEWMNRFLASLPNEIGYDGPNIDIPLLIKLIRSTPAPPAHLTEAISRLQASSSSSSLSNAAIGAKRKGGAARPPPNDVFRARRKMKQ